jgi:hypothetical protein
MSKWNANKPFGYLHTIGRDAIAAAIEWESKPDHLRAIANSREDAELCDRLRKQPGAHGSVSIEKLRHVIFGGNENWLVGRALLAASQAFTEDNTRGHVRATYSRVLACEYGVTAPLVGDMLTDQWLEELVAMVSECKLTERPFDTAHIDSTRIRVDGDDELRGHDILDSIERVRLGQAAPHHLVEQCIALLTPKTDPEILIAVIGHLGRHDAPEYITRISKLLAALVLDESLIWFVRDMAYQSIYMLHRLPVDTWPEIRRAQSAAGFPQDVDWDLVHQCLTHGSPVFREAKKDKHNL